MRKRLLRPLPEPESTDEVRMAEINVIQEWPLPRGSVFLYTLETDAPCDCPTHRDLPDKVPWPCEEFRLKMGPRWDFAKNAVMVRGGVYWNWYLVPKLEERILDALGALMK